jgi:hypothetical protein
MTAINIMQERITRIHRAAGSSDMRIQPRPGQPKMMDFDPVENFVEQGYISVREKMEQLKKPLAAQCFSRKTRQRDMNYFGPSFELSPNNDYYSYYC